MQPERRGSTGGSSGLFLALRREFGVSRMFFCNGLVGVQVVGAINVGKCTCSRVH
jgi:hypothetical protein